MIRINNKPKGLNYQITDGKKPTIVFLHGMVGSTNYWNGLLPHLKAYRLIRIDLLGFGKSPKPKDNSYKIDQHISAIYKILEPLLDKNEQFILVGHSMGALISLALAQKYPNRIKKMVLLGTPLFMNPETARNDIANATFGSTLFLYEWPARVSCWLICNTRPLARLISPLFLRNLPAKIAKDMPLHTWISFSRSLKQIIENQSTYLEISKIRVPGLFIYGSKDSVITSAGLNHIKKNGLFELEMLPGTHHLTVESPIKVSNLIKQAISS